MTILSLIMAILTIIPLLIGLVGTVYFFRAFMNETGFYAFLSAIFMAFFFGIFSVSILGICAFIGIILNLN